MIWSATASNEHFWPSFSFNFARSTADLECEPAGTFQRLIEYDEH